jgi:hypothetical protein
VLERGNVDFQIRAEMRMLLGQEFRRQPLVQLVRDARGPVGKERLPVVLVEKRRVEVIK